MQRKETTPPLNKHFENTAKVSDNFEKAQLDITLKIGKIGSKREQEMHKKIKERQANAMRHMQERFDRNRKKEIAEKAKIIRHDHLKSIAPELVLRPRDMPPKDISKMEKNAHLLAQKQQADFEKDSIQKVKDEFLQEQQRQLQKIQRTQDRKKQFSSAAAITRNVTKSFNKAAGATPPTSPALKGNEPSPQSPNRSSAKPPSKQKETQETKQTRSR